jgi:glutamate synthase domain-containing protein 3
MCLADWGGGYSVFAGTTGGEVYVGEDGGERWSLIASGLTSISKKGHERLLAAS